MHTNNSSLLKSIEKVSLYLDIAQIIWMVLLIPRAYPFPGKSKRNALIPSFSRETARFIIVLKS